MEDPLLPGAHHDMAKHHEKELRVGFIRKTLGIVCAQLAFTTLIVYLIISSESNKSYLKENLWVVIVSVVAYIVLIIILVCCKHIARKVPTNYILLSMFTLSVGVMVGFICSYYEANVVFNAFVVTVIVTLALTFYALTSKVKIQYLFGAIIIVFVSMLVVAIMMILGGLSTYLHGLYCFFGVILYGLFLIWDVRRLTTKKYGLSHEDYVFGAMMIYLDVINLFLKILQLFSKK